MADSWANGYYIRDDYLRNIARGLVAGASIFLGYGKRVSAAAETGVLWPNGAYAFPPSTGVQLSLVSTSASDAPGGTGIYQLEIHYLDVDLIDRHETVTLNGLTPVLTVATNIRMVQCMHMLPGQFGTLKAAAGNISASVGAQNYSYIAAGDVRCSSSVRMVPAGKRLLVLAAFSGAVSGTASEPAEIQFASPNFEGHDYTSSSVFIPQASGGFQDMSAGIQFPCPYPFYEGQSVGLIYRTGKANVTIAGTWFGILENV